MASLLYVFLCALSDVPSDGKPYRRGGICRGEAGLVLYLRRGHRSRAAMPSRLRPFRLGPEGILLFDVAVADRMMRIVVVIVVVGSTNWRSAEPKLHAACEDLRGGACWVIIVDATAGIGDSV